VNRRLFIRFAWAQDRLPLDDAEFVRSRTRCVSVHTFLVPPIHRSPCPCLVSHVARCVAWLVPARWDDGIDGIRLLIKPSMSSTPDKVMPTSDTCFFNLVRRLSPFFISRSGCCHMCSSTLSDGIDVAGLFVRRPHAQEVALRHHVPLASRPSSSFRVSPFLATICYSFSCSFCC